MRAGKGNCRIFYITFPGPYWHCIKKKNESSLFSSPNKKTVLMQLFAAFSIGLKIINAQFLRPKIKYIKQKPPGVRTRGFCYVEDMVTAQWSGLWGNGQSLKYR